MENKVGPEAVSFLTFDHEAMTGEMKSAGRLVHELQKFLSGGVLDGRGVEDRQFGFDSGERIEQLFTSCASCSSNGNLPCGDRVPGALFCSHSSTSSQPLVANFTVCEFFRNTDDRGSLKYPRYNDISTWFILKRFLGSKSPFPTCNNL